MFARPLILAVAALLTSGFASGASAPPRSCHLPKTITPAPELVPPANEIVRDQTTAFYMLALTWAPEACRGKGGDPELATQCQANNFGFILHGLWPDGMGGRHPRYCGPAPALSVATVKKHLCMTPSAASLQHEWAAHGTCGWATPEAYFEQASVLWRSVKLPSMAATMTAGQIREAFVKANPSLIPVGINLRLTSDNRLRDVRLCYDLDYRPSACPGGIGAEDDVQVKITPRRPR